MMTSLSLLHYNEHPGKKRAGIYRFVSKPVQQRELIAVINVALEIYKKMHKTGRFI